MAVLTEKATERRSTVNKAGGKGEAYGMKVLCATIELALGDTLSTVDFGRIPSNARILSSSRMYNDDLASTTSPTFDIGLINVDGNITDDPNAIGEAFSLSAAANDVLIVGDAANAGLPAWDFVSGQASDPGGEFIVQGRVEDDDTSTVGTITLELHYYLD